MEGIKLTAAFVLLIIGISSAFGQDQATTEQRCPEYTRDECLKLASDECDSNSCKENYSEDHHCCNYTCDGKNPRVCLTLVNVTVNQECTRGSDTFPHGTTDIPSTIDDCNKCTCSNGELQCTTNPCPTTEQRCPEYTNDECLKLASDECDSNSCKVNYSDDHHCCNYTCDGKNPRVCLTLVNVTVNQDCTRGDITIENGEINFPLADGCNSCNCTDGSLECTDNTCNSCEYEGKTHKSGTSFESIDGCNSCGCSDGQVFCTLKACAGCEYGGNTFKSGDSFESDDGCNTCSCKDGQISCTEMACIEPCNMKEFRECFVRMTEITFYERIASDKQWICNARHTVQSCLERNLQQCKKEIGSVMSMVLKPYVTMFRTVGDLFCKRDITIGRRDRENVMRAGGCILDFAHVAVKSSIVATCSQARASLQCVKEATHSCTDRSRNIFSMVTNVFESTIHTSCKPDTCNLGMAETCIDQGYVALGAPLYRDGGSVLSCGWLRSTVACAFRHTMDCEEQYRGDNSGIGDDMELGGKDNGDTKSDDDSRGNDRADGQDMYDGEEKHAARVKQFLEFIKRMRSTVGEMKEERLEDMKVDEEEKEKGADSDGPVCDLSADQGPCRAAYGRYYYNSETMKCDKFIYGGCQGNENNFKSEEECKNRCLEICKLPMVIGRCKAAIPRWFYNSETKACEEFTYGGCDGNENNFERPEDCESQCNMMDDQRGRAETAEEMEDKEKQEKSVNQLEDHLDTIKERVYKLVRNLEGKPDNEGDADANDMFEELESMVDKLKGDIKDAMTGSSVKRNLHRLEMLKVHVVEFMEKNPMEMEDRREDTEEMRTKIGEMKEYLETEVKHHMEDLMERFESIKESIKFLTSKEDRFCKEGADMDSRDVESGLESVFVISALLDNPFANKEKICRLHEKIEMSAEMRDMGRDIPRELQRNIEASFEYMRVVVGKICMPEEEEECVPVDDPEATCDPIAIKDCFDDLKFARAVQIAHRDDMYAGVCWMAEDALKCVKRNTGTCKEGEMPDLAMSIRTMIDKFLDKGICEFNLGQECEPVPVCDPSAAIDQCFIEPGVFEGFCEVFKGKTLKCIKEKLAGCKHSGAVTLVQLKMDDFIARHDPTKECGIEVSLMYEDVLAPVEHCFVQMMHGLKYGLKTQLTFNDALCMSQATYYECIKDEEMPSLMGYLSSRHDGFYLDFWEKNCAWMEEMDKEDDNLPEGPVCSCLPVECENPVTPHHPPGECSCPVCPEDLSGCDLDKAVQAVAKYWFQTSSVIGLHWATDMYANYCSMDKVTALEELFSNELGNTCAPSAVEYLKSGLPFFRSMRDQYCPWEPKIPEGSCSLQGVKKCIEHFGQFMAQYSPRGDACGPLKQGMECVMKYAIDCDADTESKISTEIDYLLSVSATEKCEQPSWCNHDDMEPEGGVGRQKRQAEDTDDENKPTLSEALVNLTCSVKVCDLQVDNCYRETTEETCMNASEVRSCIAAHLVDCPLPLKVSTRTYLTNHVHMFVEILGLSDTDSCNLVPDELLELDNHELDICTALLKNPLNETGNICGAMNRYTQCMRSDLSNEEIPRLYHSVLSVQMEIFSAFHSDYCTMEDENTMNCELVRCAAPDCNNSYVPKGGCCKVCPPDCSAFACLAPGCENSYVPEGECCPKCPEEQCPDDEKIASNLNALLRRTAVLPYFPLAYRDEMCHKGEEMFDHTREMIYACPDERKEKFHEAIKILGGLIDTMGFCSKDPMPRNCDTEQAMMCVTDLAHSVLEAEKTGFKHSMCSQLNRQAICVTVNTLGCRPSVKQAVEKTYWDVQSVVYKKCTPPPEPEPSMQCMASEARGQRCDANEAIKCMYDTFTELACDQPYWKKICPNVPFMSACVERHLYGCSREQKVVVMEIADKLKSRVRGHCPQVECDVCGAERCLATLDDRTDNEGYCRDATEALRCVKSKTEHCGEDHAGKLWSRVKMISQRVDQVCMNKVHYCLNDFKDTVLSLMMYKGPTFDIEKNEDKDGSSEEESESSESGTSKMKSSKESKDSKAKSSKESKDSKAKSSKESKDSKAKSSKESKDSKAKSSKESKDSKAKSSKESKDSKAKSSKESKDSKAKSSKESKDSKAKSSKESKDSKAKSSKESKASKTKESGNSKDTYCEDIAYVGEPWWNDDHIQFLMEMFGEGKDMRDRYDSGESSWESDESSWESDESSWESGESSGTASSDGGSSGKVKSGKLKSGKESSGNEKSAEGKSAKGKSGKGKSGKGKSAEGKSAIGKSAEGKSAKGSSDKDRTPRAECVHKRPVPLHRDLNRLCMKLYDSLRCIESHMFLLDGSIRESVEIAVYSVLQTASQKCRALPLQCKSCNKAKSHQECDAQGEMTCPPSKQFCITSEKLDDKGKVLTISKGCAKMDEHCIADNGRKKSCCSSPHCNKGAPKNESDVIQEPHCNLFSKTYCALSLASSLVKAQHMDCSMLSETLDCMSTVDEACMGKAEANMIKMYTKRLRQSRAWTRCLAQERTCRCGGHTVLALNTIFNPYTSTETVCRHFHSAYEIAKNLNWNKCSMEEHEFVKMNMGVAYSRISGMCLPEEPVCPELSDLSVEYRDKCSAETMCSCGEGETCCRYECGEVCVKIEDKPDDVDQDKEGFCPSFDADAVGICPVECGKDAECNGTKKCCDTACPGSKQCIEPQKEDPDKEKEGYCPLVDRGAFGICVVECGKDSMCDGKKKCCDSPCGFGQCRDPLDDRPVPCREGVEEAQCFARPCDVNKCSNIPDAKCLDNYCGGCHARFMLDGDDVTSMCDNNPVDQCDMELERGTAEGCEENTTVRYYFNTNTSKCEMFNFTGCNGNNNNFANLQDCSNTCKPACSQQIDRKSDCGLSISSWGFNSESGMCEEFMYGGCGGNKNRFNSQWGCLEKCIGVDMLNETCSKVGETLKDMTDVWKKDLQSLPKPFKCSFLRKEVLPKAEMILKKCYLEDKREELRNVSMAMLESFCEEEVEETNSGEEEDQKFCYSFENIKKTCFMSIDASNSTQDHCADLQTVKDCVVKMTGSCNVFRMEPVNVDFKMVAMSLKDASIDCNISMPEPSESPLQPVKDCVDTYLGTFTTGLADQFIPLNDMEEMCSATGEFRKCIYKIGKLPVKHIVGNMVDIATKLHKDLCIGVPEFETPEVEPPLQCYSCSKKEDNDECNGGNMTCPFNKPTCFTDFSKNLQTNQTSIRKTCVTPAFAKSVKNECNLKGSKFHCQYVCSDGSMCNKEQFPNGDETSEISKRRKRQENEPEVDERDSCNYKEFGVAAVYNMRKLFQLQFDHYEDYNKFCSGQEEVASAVMEYMVNCSTSMTERMDTIYQCFSALSEMSCPQPIRDMEEEQEMKEELEEEEEPEKPEEETVCNVQTCFKPILSYFSGLGSDPECIHIPRALECVSEKLPECNNTQILAIRSTLKTLRRIVPNDSCVDTITRAVCEARVDPDCDLAEAVICEGTYANSLLITDQAVKCLNNKNQEACVNYYVKNCNASDDKTGLLEQVDALTDCPADTNITANFDPDPCDYVWEGCDLIAAARTNLEFILGNDTENPLKAVEVKDEILEHVSGCQSLPYTVVEAVFVNGTDAIQSIAGATGDHPWNACIENIMTNMDLETMCMSFDNFLQCIMATEPASDIDHHMMAEHIKHLEAFNKTCKQPEMEIPAGGDCEPRSTAKCVLTYGMLFAMGPFMPLHKKIDFCNKYGAVMGECSKWDSCSSEHVTVLQNVFDDLHEKSSMCQEPEDPVWPCDWEMCFETVAPFINSVAVDGKCCHIERTVQCVRKMLPECDISQKSAIASSLKTLRGVIPNDMCVDNLSKAVCEVERRDPECDVDKADDCAWDYEVEVQENSTQKCLKNQNHKACVMFYASKCDNDTKAPLMQELAELTDCPEDTDINADFNPNPCSYVWGKCDLIAAASTSLEFIQGDNSEDCLKAGEVKDEILEHVSGCQSLPYTVVEAGLLAGTTCLDSIAGVTDVHPWNTCIENIMTNITLETVCTRLQEFQTCIEVTKPTSPIHYMMAEHITKLRSTCIQPEEPIPTDPGCAPLSAAKCILTHGLLYTLAPFLPNDGKKAICKQYGALTDACLTDYDSCSAPHVTVIKDFFDNVVKESKMCDEPMELECPKDPEEPEKPKCDPEMAMTFVSELGLSLSDCISSKKLKEEVCSSVTFIRRRVIAATMDCPDSIQYKVLASWTSLMEVVDSVCEGKKPDRGLPDIDKTPVCIREDYMNTRGTCKPGIALGCLAQLEQAVFEPQGTETGFCVLMRYATKCFIDHTTNCDPAVGLAVNPLMKRTLELFSEQCPTTWCPYEEEPEMCDIEAAHSCVTSLKMSIQEDKHRSCSMIEQTKSCIAKATVDCTEKYGLLVSKAYEQVQLLSSIACVVEKPEVDPNACIKHYKELGLKLSMVGHPNGDDDDDETDDTDDDDEEGVNSGSDDDNSDGGTTKTGSAKKSKSKSKDSKEKSAGKSKDSKEKSASKSKDSKEKSAGKSKDSKEKSAGKSKDSKEKSAGKTKDSKEKSAGKTKDSKEKSAGKSKDSSRGSWTNEVSREYENTVRGICLELEAAWECVEATLDTLTLKRKTVVSMIIKEVKATMAEKCKPIHCYTCNDLSDNEDCNNQPTCACPTGKQMCMSKYDGGKYEKRCASRDECDECQGKENCYCCNGHKCNDDGTSDEPIKCDVNIAIDYAFDLIFVTMATDTLQLSLIQGNLQCIIEHTKGCKTKQYYMLYTICVEIETLFELGTCVSNYGDPLCGTVGILSLDHIRVNPYREYSLPSVCRQYAATSDMVIDVIGSEETCSARQLEELQTAFHSAEQQLSGVCVANQDPTRICNTDKALKDCLEDKTWLLEGASECSPEMLSAFKNCCIDHTKGCTSALRSVLFNPVNIFFEKLPGNCAEDHAYDRDALLAEIFVTDDLSVITGEYVNFISKIQQALIYGSLNFVKDLCNYADELKSGLSGIESNQLQSVSGTNTADTILEQLEDVCDNTNFTDEDVKEECKGKTIDMVMVLDSSGSIGPKNFELVRQMALKAISLADFDSGSVRMSLVQFSTNSEILFGLNDHVAEIDGKSVQNRTALEDTVDGMNFTKGETYTATAIKTARDELVLNKRLDAKWFIVLFTDGKPSDEGSEAEARAAWGVDIKIFVIAVGQERTPSINAIASPPAEANIRYLEKFEELDLVFTEMFKRFCQESTVSECDFVELVYESCTALLSSMTSSYASIGQTSSVCRKIDSIYTSVTNLSATCAGYQQNALQLIQSLTVAQSREICLQYRTDEFDQTCDIDMAKMCVSDMAQFLSSARFYEDTVCRKISTTVGCLKYYAPLCEDKAAILKEIDYSLLILMNRCPDELVSLRCWATERSSENRTDTPTDTGPPNPDQCDIAEVALECALNIPTFSLGGDVCSSLLVSVQTAFTCGVDKFISVLCPVDALRELSDYFLGEVKSILQALAFVGDCELPEELEYTLPEGYGVIEARTCEVMPRCNLTAAEMCLNTVSMVGEGCRNWADVEQCYNGLIAECNPRERIVFQREMAAIARNNLGIPEDCLAVTEQLEGGCVIELETENNCDMFTTYVDCLEQLTTPMSEISSHSRILDHFNGVLNGYCSEAPVVEDPTDDCAVTDKEIKCVNDYVYRVTNALYLSQSGKERLCETYKVSDLGCFTRKYSCSAGQPHGWLWERYRMAKAYIFFSDVCSKTPFICSTRFAYSCITDLSVAVTEYDYRNGNKSVVCDQLQETRSCLRQTLTGCDLYQQQSMMKTFKDIECLAKDICTTDNWEQPDPEGRPAKCFDKALVDPDSPCKPMRSKECISNFEWVAKNPFARNQNAANLAYSDMLPCVYTNVANCGTATIGLVSHYLDMTLIKYKDWKFPTVMRSPCEEETDCTLTAAKACVKKFTDNLDTYRKDGTVCQQIEYVKVCIKSSKDSCSDAAIVEIDAMYEKMVEDADATCTEDFISCADTYISYANKILQWKSCVPEETEETDEETVETKPDTGTASKSKEKSKEKSSKENSKEKSSKENSKEKSSKENSKEKSSKEKTEGKSKRRRRRSEESKSAKSEKNSKSAKTEKNSKSKSPKSATPREESRTDGNLDLVNLRRMCTVFINAWTCVETRWDSLDGTIRTVVQGTFSAYHNSIMDICNGPRPGFCNKGGYRDGMDGCHSDLECNSKQKCCNLGEIAACVNPKDFGQDCCEKFQVTSRKVLKVVKSFYHGTDDNQEFCRLYSEEKVAIEASLSMSCPILYFRSIKVSWEAALVAYEKYCLVTPPPPTVCEAATAQLCIDVFEDIENNNEARCNGYSELELCLKAFFAECDYNEEADRLIITDVNAKLTKIKDSLLCADIPDVVLSNTCESTIVIKEGQMPGDKIDIKLAEDPAESCSDGSVCEIHIEHTLTQPKNKMPKCSNGQSIPQLLIGHDCDMVFTSDNWNVSQTLTMFARVDLKKDQDFTAKLKISAVLYVDGVKVQKKTVQKCVVLVRDEDTDGMCSSVNDPHLKTFDGLKYDNMIKGEAVLYRHRTLPYEVRTILTKCNWKKKKASCNCGVSVKAGDDTFLLSRCNGNTEEIMYLNAPLTKNFRILKGKDGRKYTIVLPTGTKVLVVLEKGGKGLKVKGEAKLINIFITPAPADRGQVLGMCGDNNGDPDNDIQDRDGNVLTDIDRKDYTQSWATEWKITSDFQFLGVNADQFIKDIEDSVCTGTGQQCTCDLSNLVETCELNFEQDISLDTTIVRTGVARRKRAVGDPYAVLGIDDANEPVVLAVFPTESGITFEEANQTCYDALTTAGFSDTCSSIVSRQSVLDRVDGCIEDTKFMDSYDFLQSAVNALSQDCEEAAKTSTNTSLINNMRNVTCPSQCSGHGACVNSSCECDDGFRSADCSIDISVPPLLEELSLALCQPTAEEACVSVTLNGDDFISEAVCHLQTVQVTSSEINKTGSTVKNVPAQWISLERVTCDLTQSGSLPLQAVLVSVSNNGQVTSQSDQLLYVAHNPTCFSCTQPNQTEGTCIKQRASCFVDGHCYGALEPSQSDPCYICNVNTQQMMYNVSQACPPASTTAEPYIENEKARQMNDSVVIGLSAGAAGLFLVLIVIVVMVMFMRHMNMKAKRSDTKELTHRSSSGRSSEDGEGFGELVYPAFGNYGYQGYPGQGYPAMYLEAPQDLFVDNIPKRHSSRQSDPTRDRHDRGEHRRSGPRQEDYYDNRQGSR